MTLGAPGQAWMRPTVPTCAPGSLADDAVDHLDEPRRREQRVVPLVHRRRARVVGEAGHRHVPLADADDALDDADVDARGVEDAALLDVQLEVGGDVALRAAYLGQPRGVAADAADALAIGLAARRHVRQVLRGELAAPGAAAVEAALLVRPDDDFERVALVTTRRSASVCATSIAAIEPTSPS